MPKQLALVFTLFCLCSLLVSCSAANNSGTGAFAPPLASPVAASPSAESPVPAPTSEPVDLIKEQVNRMTVDEKIGQMVIVGLEGTTMQADAEEMIETYHIGGFILYKDNMTDAPQTLSLLNQLKKKNLSNTAPLWLSVDQEGGKVSRMPADFVKLPTARDVGRVNDPAYSYQIGQALGAVLHALGFNMDFAPVLDINSNPKNPVIGDRSYGTDAQVVIRHGLEVMKGIQSGQVAAVVKHFPGHGDTAIDSHLELPVVSKSLSELEQFELQPFMEAIKQNADAVMVAHLLIPNIDDTYPASISDKIITSLLRERLGYEGVVITDDMTMGGITNHYDIDEAAVRSIKAGSDILLIGHHYDQQISALRALKTSIEDGTLTTEQLDDSVYRILSLKAKYKLKDEPVNSIDLDAVNSQINQALAAGKTK